MPRAPMPRPTPWPRAALAALFMAFALTTLAPDNAAAQTAVPDTLDFGTITLSNGVEVNLNLIAPVTTGTGDTVYTFTHVDGTGEKVVTVTGGKTYYFLDAGGGGTAEAGQIGQGGDSFAVADMKLFFADSVTDISDTQDGNHDGGLDERSYTIGGGSTGGGSTLVLPTVAEWEVLRASAGGVPEGWLGTSNRYASSSPGRPGGAADNYNYQLGHSEAVDGPGTSPYSDNEGLTRLLVAVQVIAPTAPAVPTGVTATNGNGESVVTWEPVPEADNGGSAVISYTATAINNVDNNDFFTCTADGADADTCTIIGLANGTEYSIVVFATNSVDNSLDSTAVTATPGVPAPPTVTLVAGPMQIEVSWTAPTDIGASAITGYICEYFIPGMGRVGTIDVDATATACTITGLTDNTRYRVIVRATNSHGSSAASANAYAIPSDIRLPDVDDQDYTVGQTVAFTLPEAIGGTPPYTYTIAGQALARFPGLTFTASERTITGTPTATESRTIRYRATDSTTGGVNPNVAEASFTITVVDAAELRFTETVAERIYPIDISQGNRVPAVTPGLLLPEAEGGITPWAYTLNPDISNFTGGALRFNPASRRISRGSPSRTASQVFIYTARDGTTPTPQTASLTFKISTVEVAGDGTAVTDVDGTALAVDDVGTTDHNLRLFMPADHAATTFRVTTYTPDPATPPDGGYIFSGVAMDIDLRPGSADSIPTGTEATVCLSTTGVQPSYAPALFLGTTGGVHVQGAPDGWVSIGSEIRTRGGDRYVCGETSEFAPYFAVASKTTGPAIILTPPTRTLAEGSTTTYTVALATMPTVDVTVTITGHTGTDVTPDMTTLTFTTGATGTWGTAQTVTLTAREDADAVDDDVTLMHTASGGDYGGGSVTAITADFTATVTENDAVGLTLTPGALTFAEGGTATYTVTLNSQPTTDVALTIASSNTDVTPNQNTLTFAAGNWDTPQTVILTDAEADGDAVNDTVMLAHTASGGEYGSVTGTLTFTVTDDDAPGLILTPPTRTLTEGTTATYTVRLNTVPTAMVTVTIADATTHVTPTPAALTFTTGEWDTAQTVTITAVQDDDAVNESVTLTHTAAGGDYASLSGNLAVNIEDDETRGLTLTPDALTFDEGGTATYTAVLDSEPSATVTVNIIGDNPDVTPTPAVLTFTTSDWRLVQTVTLTDNELDDTDAMNDMVTLMHTASGGDYGGGGITAITAALTFTVTDDDIAFDGTIKDQRHFIHQEINLTLPVATNGVGTVTYELDRITSNLMAPLLAPGLSFDSTTTPPTISGVPTAEFGSASLVYTATDSSTPAKTGVLGFLFRVVDERGISLNRTTVTLTEEGDNATYTVVLNSEPTVPVTVTIDSDNTYVGTMPASLTFAIADWSMPQTVTITAADDMNMTNDAPVMLTHTAAGGDYGGGGGVTAVLSVTVIDNDIPNLTLTPNRLMLNEGGSGDTHTVALTITSSAAVTVNIVSDNTDVTPTPDALTFAADASSPQTVTLTALEDGDTMPDSATLTYTASGGASGTYNGVFGTVTVTVNDNDDPPMFSATTDIADRIYPFFTPNVTIPTLTLPAADGGSGTLSYALNGALPTGLSFTGGTSSTSSTLSGAPTASSSASLTYTVTDGGSGLEDSLTFSVSVVTVTGDGTAVADGDGTALAVNDVGTTDHNLRLFMPDGHTVTTVKVTTYTPEPATPPDGGYIFSGVAMDIDLGPGSSATTIPTGEATVCLSTTGVQASYAPALFLGTTGGAHVQGTPDGWVSIGSEIRTRGGDKYVCGETREFAPYFAVASMPNAEAPEVPTLSFASTVANRIYLAGIDIPPLTLPEADGGTSPLGYTLTPQNSIPAGLSFDTDDRTLTGTPTKPVAIDSPTLTYTVTDSATPSPQTASLTFSVSVRTHEVSVPDSAMVEVKVEENVEVLAIDNVGGDNNNNNVRLPLTGGLTLDTALTVTTYTPPADTVPAANYAFSGVAVDINIDLPPNTEATVCLSTVGVPDGHNPALFHYDTPSGGTAMWNNIGTDITTRPGFVCGTTDTFSPVAVGSEAATSRLTTISEIILPEVARAMTDNTVRAITQRFDQARTARQTDTAASAFTLGGQSTLADVLRTGGQALADGTLNMNNILGNSAFVLPLSSGGGVADTLTLWGSGGYSGLGGGGGGAMDWDGNLVSAHLGADAQVGDTLLAGAAVSWNQGDFDYGALTESPEQGGGNYAIEMTSITPYAEWAALPDDRLNIWGTAGYGEGEVTIIDSMVAAQTNDTSMVLWGGGASGRILKNDAGELRLKSELMQTQLSVAGGGNLADLTVEARRMRVSLAGTTTHTLADGAHLTPSIEVGMRNDSGSGRTGTGAEVGGGVRYTSPVQGITFESRSRVLLGHTGDYDDWGIGGALAWNTGQGGQGLALRLAPTYGQTQTQTAQLWDQGAMDLTGTDAAALGQRMDAEVGYGLTALDGQGLLTPYSKMTWGQGARAYRLGSRLTLASGLTMSFEGVRGETLGATAPAHHLQWQTGWRWLTASMQASGVERRMQLQAEWQW